MSSAAYHSPSGPRMASLGLFFPWCRFCWHGLPLTYIQGYCSHVQLCLCISFVQVGGQLSYHGGLKWQAASPTTVWANVRCNGGLKTSNPAGGAAGTNRACDVCIFAQLTFACRGFARWAFDPALALRRRKHSDDERQRTPQNSVMGRCRV